MPIQVIRVKQKDFDKLGAAIFEGAKKIVNGILLDVKTARVYRLEGITKSEAKKIVESLFCEEITQEYTLNRPILNKKNDGEVVKIEIAYKPGVMNPEVASIIKATSDLGINLKAVDSSTEYGFYGQIRKREVHDLVSSLKLYNNIVEHIVEYEPSTLLIKGKIGQTKVIPIRNLSDEQLLELSEDKLFLNLEEMKVIQKNFQEIKRDPTDVELETIAQTWSEHCAHKTFKAKLVVDGKEKESLFTRLKKESLKYNKNIVSAFLDNSGVMDFYEGWAICGKAETHNSPSAIEPYGGAATGSGGVFRDVVATGQGAKCIASTDIFCLAPPNMSDSKLPPGCLSPDYILRRVVEAVRDYGNRMGIPTNNGSFHFHEDFRAKPTVLVGAYGILPKSKAKKGEPKVGDIALVVGGRTGRDGIHGATFSSGEMTHKTTTVNSSAVQIGNAIEEKRTFDAILEASSLGLIRAVQDCGAGGFSSALGELGEKIGIKIQLENALLKYQGLAPWEIWISESQERMAIVLSKKNIRKFLKICQKNNVEVSILGAFDGSKRLKVYFGKEKVADLDMKFLHHGLPQRTMVAKNPSYTPGVQLKFHTRSGNSKHDKVKFLKKVLSSGDICSKEPIVRLYDHSVQGTNALQPFSGELMDGPNDAVVLKPILNKKYGVVISHGLNPIFNSIDPYWGSIWACSEAISNYAAVGGDYREASLINNYIWPFPDEESLWSLDRSVTAVCDFMKALKIPVISGKDSLSSTYRDPSGKVLKIPPVLCMSVFGKIPDVKKTVTSDFKRKRSLICLVGKMDWQVTHLRGVPKVDLKVLPKVLSSIYSGIKSGKILACHDVSEGGLITAVFEMCVGGNCGAQLNITNLYKRSDFALFNETAGCFIVEVKDLKTANSLFKKVPIIVLGKTQDQRVIEVTNKNKRLFEVELTKLKIAWRKPMKEFFR